MRREEAEARIYRKKERKKGTGVESGNEDPNARSDIATDLPSRLQ
jgi:hypothetical protein